MRYCVALYILWCLAAQAFDFSRMPEMAAWERAQRAAQREEQAQLPHYLALLETGNETARLAALEWIGDRNQPDTVEPVLRRLADPSAAVRVRAIAALRTQQDCRIEAALLGLLSDRDAKVRLAAVHALINRAYTPAIAPLAALTPFRERRVVDALAAALDDDDRSVVWYAAEALARQGDARAIPVLCDELHESSDDSPWRLQETDFSDRSPERAAMLLGMIGERRVVPELIALLWRTAPGLRASAAAALTALTGQQLGEDPERWLEWWAGVRD